MSPWEFLGWAVAVAVSLIVMAIAIAVVIAAVKSISAKQAPRQIRRRQSE